MNWVVAASFKLLGARNEWTARLPSALCLLAVAFVFAILAQGSLGSTGSLFAALIWLTNFGMIEKGRLIEIEALYVSLFGLAFVCWLSWWEQERSRWLTWTIPFLFLGLGLLAKGPLHLFFFYALVFFILWRAGELRQLFTPAHFLGIALMLGIFAAWAVPYLQSLPHSGVAHVWSRQFSGRLEGQDFHLRAWLLNIPRGLAYFLPWLLLLPLGGTVEAAPRQKAIRCGLAWGVTLPFFLVNLIPGALPRYTMPLLVPAAWLLAGRLTSDQLHWPRWLGGTGFSVARRNSMVTAIVVVTVLAMLLYAFVAVPELRSRQKIKSIAAQIDAAVPPGEPLYAVDPDYQPFLFYVQRPLIYVDHVSDLPPETRFFLVRERRRAAAVAAAQFAPRHPQPVLRIRDYRNWKSVLFSVGP